MDESERRFRRTIILRAVRESEFFDFLRSIVECVTLSEDVLNPNCERCVFRDECVDDVVNQVAEQGFCLSYVEQAAEKSGEPQE